MDSQHKTVSGCQLANNGATKCTCPLLKQSFTQKRTVLKSENLIIVKNTWNLYIVLILIVFNKTSQGHAISKEDIQFCNSLNLIRSSQEKFCQESPDVVRALVDGYKRGYEECKKVFKNSSYTGTRWNCTNSADERNVLFGIPHPRVGSREAGVMSSFTAAGMLHNLVLRCKQGKISTCKPSVLYTCPLNGQKIHSNEASCKHINWDIPLMLINRFLTDGHQTLRNDVENHNRNIGFRVVKTLASMKKHCKGSSCQEDLRPLEELNNGFVSQYKTSVRLKKKNRTGHNIPTQKKLNNYNRLLHYRVSYNYCKYDPVWKWNGIGRRECKETTNDDFSIENCVNMCCGFGYIVVNETKNVCSTSIRPPYIVACQSKTIEKYYCKYSNEAARRPPDDFVWRDPPRSGLVGHGEEDDEDE